MLTRTLAAVLLATVGAGCATQATADEADLIHDVRAMADDTTDGRAGYLSASTFDVHFGDRVGELCGWVDAVVDDTATADEAAWAVHQAADSGDGLPMVLLTVCGYHGSGDEVRAAGADIAADRAALAEQTTKLVDTRPSWWMDPPYPWGEVRPSPDGTSWPVPR